MSGRLGEPEKLWEHEPLGKSFNSFLESCQTFTSIFTTCLTREESVFYRFWKTTERINEPRDYNNFSMFLCSHKET